jgi:hypothetical protein
LRRIIAQARNPKIKNPPKRVRKSAALLGFNSIGFRPQRGA